MEIDTLSADHYYDLAAKYLARTSADARHSFFGHLDGQPSARFADGWRFPIVEPYREADDQLGTLRWNAVSFFWRDEEGQAPAQEVAVLGDFGPMHEVVGLKRVEQSRYRAATLRLPIGRVCRYLFRVDAAYRTDPINPRTETASDGSEWSLFFTNFCTQPVTFEVWERALLLRLVVHILPFNTREAEVFLQRVDRSKLGGSRFNLYRFDQEVGVVNFIDKLLAGPEFHQRSAYKTCLKQMDRILRMRNPFEEPKAMAEELYVQLYNDLASGDPPVGWDTGVYGNPSHFLKMLRRHVFMGAFSHPKYGGNPGGIAWDYLAERFRTNDGATAFDWRRAVESPLGTSNEYLG